MNRSKVYFLIEILGFRNFERFVFIFHTSQPITAEIKQFNLILNSFLGEQFASEPPESDDPLSPNEPYKTHLDFPIASPDTIDPTSPANDTPRSQKAEPPPATLDTPKSESRGQHNESTEKQPENYEEQSDSRDVSKGGDESSGRVSERPRSESKTESEKGSFKNQTDNNPLKSNSRLLEQIINDDP